MYNLHSLGWHSFQQLCLTITREILGQTVQSFLETNDGGRDGAFTGTWENKGSDDLTGKFVIQCKFTNKVGGNLSISKLKDEFSKAERLVKSGGCDTYILMTNAGISGSQEEKIASHFKSLGVKHYETLGSTWICDQIRENKKLRMLVPRVYGLGDLSQILDDRAYDQARSHLDSMSDDLAKVVITNPYNEALKALEEQSFVLLIGEPAAGKTTIASLLAMAAIDQWGASLLKLEEPERVKTHWNPNEPSQFFWIDDAFGATQYEPRLSLGWNRILPEIKAMIKKGAKIVMTSRDYIYRSARKDLKTSTFPLLEEQQVVINVHDLEIREKNQIVYNHMKLGNQTKQFKAEIKPYLGNVASHSQFIPEIARRLSDPIFTKNLSINESSLNRYVETKESFLQDVLTELDDESKSALALIYMRNGSLERPVDFSDIEKQTLERLGGTPNGCLKALNSLNNSLVQDNAASGTKMWRFKHPTIGDAYAALLAKDYEQLAIYIKGTSAEKIIDQITCGDTGDEKAIMVGSQFFEEIIDKLEQWLTESEKKSGWSASWSATKGCHSFLSRRCSKEFLEQYLDRHPELLDQVCKPGLHLTSSNTKIVYKLQKFGILPENNRQKFINTVCKYAIEGENEYAIKSSEFKELLSEEEYGELISRVKEELIPVLHEKTIEHCDNYCSDEDPEEHIQLYKYFLEALERKFGKETRIIEKVKHELQYIEEWLLEQEYEEEEAPVYRNLSNSVRDIQPKTYNRNIFDDVDE